MSSRRALKERRRTARTEQRRAGTTPTPGELHVLSVGHGHMKVTITPGDPAELDKARRMIEDMLSRGFSIFVERENGETRRVKKFDPKRMIYYVDPPEDVAAAPATTAAPARRPRARRYAEVPVARSRATAVGRTAGG